MMISVWVKILMHKISHKAFLNIFANVHGKFQIPMILLLNFVT